MPCLIEINADAAQVGYMEAHPMRRAGRDTVAVDFPECDVQDRHQSEQPLSWL